MENSIEQLVDRILDRAIADGATDLAFEPSADALQLRVRCDGRRQLAWQHAGVSLHLPLWSYFQQMAGLAENTDVPQRGKFDRVGDGQKYRIVVATVPSEYGTIINLKILYLDRQPPKLDPTITDREALTAYRAAIDSDRGLILITGQGDSGKSTIAAATLQELVQPERSIYAFVERVECQLLGVQQIEIGSLDLAARIATIETIIDSHPDVIFIDKIDGRELAELAIKMVEGGSLVVVTIPAASVGKAIESFIALGIDGGRLARVLLCTIAQKLLPKLCSQCRELYPPSELEAGVLSKYLRTSGQRDRYYRARPLTDEAKANICPKCNNRGYRGRIAIHEILPWHRSIESIITTGHADRIDLAAQEIGMRCFSELAIDLFKYGQIGFSEVKSCLLPQSLLPDLAQLDRDDNSGVFSGDMATGYRTGGESWYWQERAEKMETECQQLMTELEGYRQEAAEFDRRLKHNRSQVEQTTRAETALQLLTAIDTIELAKNSIKPQTDREVAIQKGYIMLDKKMLSSLREIGVCAIETIGHKFDPRFHEVMREEGTQEHPIGTILSEFRRGYLLGDRVLRLAQVKVAVAPTFM